MAQTYGGVSLGAEPSRSSLRLPCEKKSVKNILLMGHINNSSGKAVSQLCMKFKYLLTPEYEMLGFLTRMTFHILLEGGSILE